MCACDICKSALSVLEGVGVSRQPDGEEWTRGTAVWPSLSSSCERSRFQQQAAHVTLYKHFPKDVVKPASHHKLIPEQWFARELGGVCVQKKQAHRTPTTGGQPGMTLTLTPG